MRILGILAAVLLVASPCMAGDVRIVTVPPDAEVWVGATRVGVTMGDGLHLVGVTPGSITYSIRKEGYLEERRTIVVEDSEQPITLLVTLRPLSGAGTQADTPAKSEAAAAPAKKRSRKTPIVLGVIGAAAAGTGAVLLTKKDPLEQDDDMDGFSENQGDCNDLDKDVSPRGEFSITVRPDVTGTVNCTSGFNPIEVRATNLSCTQVGISAVTLTTTPVGGGCFSRSPVTTLPLSVGQVAVGARDQLIATQRFGGSVGCCGGGECPGVVCTFSETYLVSTSAGQRVSTNTYGINFPAGFSCPACASAFDLATKESRPPPR